VFNNTLPSSDYFPPASNITKKICIIDGGVWPEHPDLLDIEFTAADSSQNKSLDASGCSHGTVSRSNRLRFETKYLKESSLPNLYLQFLIF